MPTPQLPSERPAATRFPGVECRVRERRACELPTLCQPLAARADNDIQWPAKLRDISPSGLGIVLGRRFEPGTPLAVEFPGEGATPAEVLFARVVHATPRPGGFWLLGCAFVSELSEYQVQTVLELGQSQPPPPKSEPALDRFALRSRAPGYQTSAPGKTSSRTFVLLGVTFQSTAEDGTVATILIRRLYVTGSWPLPPDSLMEGWIGTKVEPGTGIQLRIHDCSQEGERWKVNYSVAGAAPAEVLRSLGHPDPRG